MAKMTRHRILRISLLVNLFYFNIVLAQTTVFEKYYGTPGDDKGRSVVQLYDGGYALTGYFNVGSKRQICLIKTNSYGDTLWSKLYPISVGGEAWSLKETFDKGFVIAGITHNNPFFKNLYIIKADSLGNLEWDKLLYHYSETFATSVIQDKDSNYVTCGFNDLGLLICKFDATGDTIWTKTVVDSLLDIEGWFIENTNDGHYIITGNIFNGALSDIITIKMDYNGGIIWQKIYGSNIRDYSTSVKALSDGGYLISGYDLNSTLFTGEAILMKLDSLGDLIWLKNYPSTKYKRFWSLAELSNTQGYVIAGQITHINDPNDHNAYLIKTDTSGNMIWEKEFGGYYNEHAHTLVLAQDSGYAIAGYTSSIGNGGLDYYFIKTDSNGNILVTDMSDLNEGNTILNVFPNPATSRINIISRNKTHFKIFNTTGEILYQIEIPSDSCIELDISFLSSGVYFVSAENYTGKLIISK